MANIKVSEMPTTTTANDEDYLMIVQNNESKKITIENLNSNFEKNIITAIGTENLTTTTQALELIKIASMATVGSKLSVSNNTIKIGSGVSYVKINGMLTFATISGVGQRHHVYIRKNSTNAITSSRRLNGTWETIETATIVIPVEENDTISLYVRSQDGTGAMVDMNGCRLTVEVVA